jgi:hypothetical protein
MPHPSPPTARLAPLLKSLRRSFELKGVIHCKCPASTLSLEKYLAGKELQEMSLIKLFASWTRNLSPSTRCGVHQLRPNKYRGYLLAATRSLPPAGTAPILVGRLLSAVTKVAEAVTNANHYSNNTHWVTVRVLGAIPLGIIVEYHKRAHVSPWFPPTNYQVADLFLTDKDGFEYTSSGPKNPGTRAMVGHRQAQCHQSLKI